METTPVRENQLEPKMPTQKLQTQAHQRNQPLSGKEQSPRNHTLTGLENNPEAQAHQDQTTTPTRRLQENPRRSSSQNGTAGTNHPTVPANDGP